MLWHQPHSATCSPVPPLMPTEKPMHSTQQPRPASPFRRVVLYTVLLAVLVLAVDIFHYAFWPPIGPLGTTDPESTSFIRYRKEEAEQAGKKLVLRQNWVPLRQISRSLVNAVLIAEDDKFWGHEGFDFDSMSDAMLQNIEKGRITAGGSTLTQQLAKNLFLTPERSFTRKIKEAILAWRLENALNKKRILELYLNVVEWGDGIFGAEAAARHYFGVSASRLTPRQAALLASILPSPRKWSASNPSRHVQTKADIILARMERRGLTR